MGNSKGIARVPMKNNIGEYYYKRSVIITPDWSNLNDKMAIINETEIKRTVKPVSQCC